MPAWIHSDPNADDGYWRDHSDRECARGDRCSDPRMETLNGKTVRMPAWTPRAFCESDRLAIAKALGDLPMLWVRVHQRLDKSFSVAGGPVVSMSKSAPVPLSLGADELLRQILAILVSWEERVRTVARLSLMDTEQARRRRDGVILSQAYGVLAAHLDALLALPEEPMLRSLSFREAATLPAGTDGLVHATAEYADAFVPLSGADAGLEMLHLARRCRSFLTDTRQAPRRLHTPCGGCGFTELREVLDDDGQHDGAKCRECGAEYDAQGYSDLAKEQAEPIRRSGASRSSVRYAHLDDMTSRRA